MQKTLKLAFSFVIATFLSSCLSINRDNTPTTVVNVQENSNVQKVNEFFFYFNTKIDWYILRPTTFLYNKITTADMQLGVINFLHNAREPLYILNRSLSGNFKKAGDNGARFFLNTVFGLGFIDFASEAGYEKDPFTMNYLLAYYNVNSGDYLMLPFKGAMTTRSLYAFAGESLVNSLYLNLPITSILFIFDAITLRNRLSSQEALIYNTLNPYLLFRSAYLQNTIFMESKLLQRNNEMLTPEVDPSFSD